MKLLLALLPAILFAPPHAGQPITLEQRITLEAVRQGVRPALALLVAKRESNMNPLAQHVNRNHTRDWGLMQINDRTVRLLHVADPLDVNQNIIAGVGVLSWGLGLCRSEAGALRYYARGKCK